MAGFITQNQNTLTWAQAAAQIVSVMGNAGDTAQETIAKSIVQDILRDMNSAREWRWLHQVTTGNVTTDGLITLPSRTKKVYALVVNNKAMQYIDERDWLRQVDLAQNVGQTAYYTGYNTAVTNKIEVRDHPSESQAYELYYLSLISIDTAADPIDVPESVMGYILAKAKADYIGLVDSGSAKLNFYTALAEQRYKRIVRDDEHSQPDEDRALKPGYLFPSDISSNLAPWGYE